MIKNYDALIAYGLDHLFAKSFRRNQKEKELMRAELIVNFPDVFEGRIDMTSYPAQYKILGMLSNKSFHTLNSPYWKTYMRKIFKNLIYSQRVYSHGLINKDEGALVLLSAFILQELGEAVDWFKIYSQFEIAVENVRYTSNVFEEIVKLAIVNEPEVMIAYIKNIKFKKKPLAVRRGVYAGLIRSGHLTDKLARRIRSDTSETVAEESIRVLFKELSKYDKPDELIGQFLDTRYDSVGLFLVSNSPDKYLPFLVGVKGRAAKKLLQKRMAEAANNP